MLDIERVPKKAKVQGKIINQNEHKAENLQ